MNEFGNGTAQCIEKSCSKNLHKSIKLSKFVKRATAELIKTYVRTSSLAPLTNTHVDTFSPTGHIQPQAAQGNFAEQFCTMSMDSLPSSTLWGSSPAERLQSAYIRLTELLPHVTMVLQQQSDLNPYLGSLLSDLARLVIHGRHLALRLSCILQKLQPNVALPEPAVGPTALLPPQNIFQQKVYGCAVLTRVQKLTLLTASELKSLRGQCTDKT
ncbi:hypothetical protein P4O66_016127 [Electrophorus voltai]|uniref:Ciliary neurotrophic factor n=1 Tax=Electrophorus voltai TaxID=2609070 RepID=A0AAD8YV33_9TELE|nr:hypothetical protein P4O66_016127 [Electrophorus voltai]